MDNMEKQYSDLIRSEMSIWIKQWRLEVWTNMLSILMKHKKDLSVECIKEVFAYLETLKFNK